MPAIADQPPRSNGSEADLANPLSLPALPKGDTFDGVNFGELEYHFFKGQASTGRYEYTDVIQGEIGDCFFLSSSVAINAVDSEFLGGHVENKPDGTHVITLFKWLDEHEPVKVAVDNQFLSMRARWSLDAAGVTPARMAGMTSTFDPPFRRRPTPN